MFRLRSQTRVLPAFRRISAMATASPSPSLGPIESVIRSKLLSSLQPAALVIHNDSYQHRHHAPMRAQDGGSGETHFSLEIVSDEFKGKTTMQRHRMIYSLLSEELDQGLHSLSLKTKTRAEAGIDTAST
ncbi:bola-like protein-domain-containing protein [Lentinula edodes]|uniref:bola-like protein-domain-containing protein n=1 Tax=Lentinula edodes TaxID=5353 RepID=UPI001E8DDACB|nr:bola-like protein-domain-containing protein [Lentinula edodes]KAH7874588.1 bola-like protein-domain-containing protein [Lentinula edodes]KAJ3923934.1 bola-like protein-domain-containing protein [Lentinula edodes]